MLWRSGKNFNPPVDVIELDDRIVILTEVAGMQTEDFNIKLMNDSLVISGTRRRPIQEASAYHRVEIGFGEFRLEVALPWSVEQEAVSASYQDGFLQIILPRQPQRKITIQEHTNQDTT